MCGKWEAPKASRYRLAGISVSVGGKGGYTGQLVESTKALVEVAFLFHHLSRAFNLLL